MEEKRKEIDTYPEDNKGGNHVRMIAETFTVSQDYIFFNYCSQQQKLLNLNYHWPFEIFVLALKHKLLLHRLWKHTGSDHTADKSGVILLCEELCDPYRTSVWLLHRSLDQQSRSNIGRQLTSGRCHGGSRWRSCRCQTRCDAQKTSLTWSINQSWNVGDTDRRRGEGGHSCLLWGKCGTLLPGV